MRRFLFETLEWRERIRDDLSRAGVDPDFAERAIERLDTLPDRLAPAQYRALVAGLEAAHELHREGRESLRRSYRNLTEIERLLPVFSGEFRKLEEALKILNAFLQRMTRRSPGEPKRLVH